MRILFLTPQLPYPPRQGTAMRNWGLLSGVARNHEVWLLSFAEDAATPHALLRETCVNIATVPVPVRSGNERVRTLLDSSLPDMAWRLWSVVYEQQLRSWLAQTAVEGSWDEIPAKLHARCDGLLDRVLAYFPNSPIGAEAVRAFNA